MCVRACVWKGVSGAGVTGKVGQRGEAGLRSRWKAPPRCGGGGARAGAGEPPAAPEATGGSGGGGGGGGGVSPPCGG